jgi:alkanesulfonate monooxygenase SsuD/methylene tetrahydromethanopterin reductase-like flavin-dependent oxidoreductase (luciferase family)
VQFVFFHLMPFTDFKEPGRDWPVANKAFDAKRGNELYHTYLDMMADAENYGFDWVGCNEHHFSPYGMMSNPNLIGAILASRTKRARLAMLGNIIPLNNPIRVAEEYAMLDVISGGRLVAGFVRGIPHEYVAYNVDPNESWGRLHEACELIIKCWTEPEPFGWEGEHFQYRSVSIWPRPLQRPHPPIMMSASNPESAVFAAKHRCKMGIVLFSSLQAAKDSIKTYKDAAKAYGWEPGPDDILVGENLSISEDEGEAREMLREGRRYFFEVLGGGPRTAANLVLKESRFYEDAKRRQGVTERRRGLADETIEDAINAGKCFCGTPEQVVEQIKWVQGELGNGIFNIAMKIGNVPDAYVRKGMKLFKDRVQPHVHNL